MKKPTLFATDRFQNRWLWEVLPDGAWDNKPCFIVGGGPSLKNFDWTKLKGYRTIGVNRAFERFEPTIIFSMDTRFLNWVVNDKYALMKDGAETKTKFMASQAYKVWLCTYTIGLPKEFFIVRVEKNYFYGLRNFSLSSMREGICHGDNSGYAAINLAVCLGANPIYLLGFDCKHENGKSHWHDGHILKQKREDAEKWKGYFKIAADKLAPTDFRVINLNPGSALECFKKMSPERILH